MGHVNLCTNILMRLRVGAGQDEGGIGHACNEMSWVIGEHVGVF